MRAPAAAVAVILLGLTAGCGDQGEQYCSALQQHRKEIAEMTSGEGPTALLARLPMLRDLAEQAPPDLTDEWQAFLNAVENLDDAIDEAGARPGQFREGRMPEGLTASERKSVQQAADDLASPDVVSATQGIEQQARDVCKVNFGL